uniref:Uncharacterized protein MANES_14G007800 n=1 Tax=Rhizophora mucronata TaxID=61149 RepID=A0A2P2JGW0_RHIMU
MERDSSLVKGLANFSSKWAIPSDPDADRAGGTQ